MDNKLIYNKAASLATASDRESYKEMNFIYKFIKRVLDIVCSILGIIFKQLRAGKGSKPFYIYKFRSMKIETPNIATNDFTDSHVYITRIGKIIRKTSIDEIPQLFNILKGDMSIVGPRPVILEEVDLIELRKSYNIDKILPGITGWAQINGRDNIGNEEKVKYDYEYLMNKSFTMDLYIIVMTALKVLKRSDIKD